jgi:putative transposase
VPTNKSKQNQLQPKKSYSLLFYKYLYLKKIMSRKYKFGEKEGAYFISFSTVYWIDVFTRVDYFDIIIESLDFCRKNKGMDIYGYCIMPSHIHLIFRSALGDPSGLIRDFKGFTSRKMLKFIEENNQESRREWMLWMFERAGKKNSNVKFRQFWQQNNKPIEIWSLKVFEQKLEYIHNNPVETGFVTDPIDWKYSSARNYGNDDHTVLEIDLN